MTFKIVEKHPQQILSIRLVGPYHETIPQGFKQLSALYTEHHIPGKDWLALYWDNPETNPPAQLRADVSLSVAPDYVLPEELRDQLQLQVIPGGLYAVYHTRVTDDDYAKAWSELYHRHLPQSGYQPAEGACYEVYLNDGTVDGYFDIEIYQSVTPV
ncbi:gyrI-like small molecule binding domain protein [Yersinia rohdei]|uniref:DNA gyrase inhibitor n=1 Tax=Yersinia rohdei TaxID=29485 RepID=A0ABM5SF37_YERRO|nr:DNA gyrase inhibitor SbmC [Yersinia rohdei]AJJ11897.1 gyrI-like small molecule binding domain protein [Yersinia rohdei]EEQ04213.1 DNA gyrase inhibitory protein [Yersinia rohdei ATCC 43380]CNE05116.1 DNA gyrase inhibitor [Yersinia rohdei]CNI32165.1 DNA gyrase inhibitor [Yersinia rohdei]